MVLAFVVVAAVAVVLVVVALCRWNDYRAIPFNIFHVDVQHVFSYQGVWGCC